MDDSVIKVLRRNSSWSKAENKKDIGLENNFSAEEFSLDKNFGVLAEEIKKRMKNRALTKENSKLKDNKEFETSDINHSSIKLKMLPYLKSIDKLTRERDNHLSKVHLIDDQLENVKNEIVKIRKQYESNLEELKNNINFFDQSIDLINKIKGDL
tara:strand:- start:5 stop:469 length:465 start_codon:yes stop_codon:yes gene_type:complete